MMGKIQKILLPIICVTYMAWSVPVTAQGVGDDPGLGHAITDAIHTTTTSEIDKKRALFRDLTERLTESFDALRQTIISVTAWGTGQRSGVMPYYDSMLDIVKERVLSRFGAGHVNLKLDEIMEKMIAAHTEVENVNLAGDENPFAGTASAGDAVVYKILTTTFCNPDSMNEPRTCRERAPTAQSNQNFVDMFLGERTWGNETIIDALLVARRFFAPVETREALDVHGVENFMASRSNAAQASLRMSILNNLAARRSPTSVATQSALEFMFRILASSSEFVMTTNAAAACQPEHLTLSESDSDQVKSIKFMTGYVCSFTSAPTQDTGERFISQAALDRILQHDFYLSSDFYGAINSTEFTDTSLERMEVFMKAQQLAQDYQQLRLLQMKVASSAMHMMNGN